MLASAVTMTLAQPLLRTTWLSVWSPTTRLVVGFGVMAAGLGGYAVAEDVVPLVVAATVVALGDLVLLGQLITLAGTLAPVARAPVTWPCSARAGASRRSRLPWSARRCWTGPAWRGPGGCSLRRVSPSPPREPVGRRRGTGGSTMPLQCATCEASPPSKRPAEPDAIAVDSYDISLDLTRGSDQFGSRSEISFRSLDGSPTFLDLQPAEVQSITLNGTAIDVGAVDDGRLPLDGLAEQNTLVVEALMTYSHDGEGLHRAVDPEDKQAYVYAMAFLPAAPRIFACFDQPDLKAIFRVSVTAPTDWIVLGNGSAEQTEPGRWTLTETKPLATYFATLVAGPYHSITSEHDGIVFGLHCRQTLAPHLDKDADELFTVTAQCFDEYHRLFGIRYPFGEYHQAFVPEFNAGAMENPGCVTFTRRARLQGTGHRLAAGDPRQRRSRTRWRTSGSVTWSR